MQAQLFSSARDDHHTPKEIIERARYTFGGEIDLDPASSFQANQIVNAKRYYADPYTTDEATLNDPHRYGFDGLCQPTRGVAGLGWCASSLWLNPPYSIDARNPETGELLLSQRTGKPIRQRVIGRWVARWLQAVTPYKLFVTQRPDAQQAMLLIPARTDTDWFRPLFGLPMAFIHGRIRFGDAENGAPFPTVIVYAGSNSNVDRFYTIFDEIASCGTLRK